MELIPSLTAYHAFKEKRLFTLEVACDAEIVRTLRSMLGD
jgi:hypothetical protein